MNLKWSGKAASDLTRLHDFLAKVSPKAARHVVRELTAAPEKLLAHPRDGEKLDEFEPREVRRIFVGDYEMRYEICGRTIFVLRLWHGKEDR